VIAGLGQEIIERLVACGGSHGPDWGMLSGGMRMDRVVFDPDMLKVVFDEMLIDAGVTALFHSMASGVEVSGRTVRSRL
jgi:FAD dependent oxidoreductase